MNTSPCKVICQRLTGYSSKALWLSVAECGGVYIDTQRHMLPPLQTSSVKISSRSAKAIRV